MVLKQVSDIDILLIMFEYFYLFQSIDEVPFKMLLILLYGVISFLLVSILRIASLAISEGVLLDREEVSAYECGFEHVSYSRLPFSFRYFFLTLIFLIFDIEVVFLLFLPST